MASGRLSRLKGEGEPSYSYLVEHGVIQYGICLMDYLGMELNPLSFIRCTLVCILSGCKKWSLLNGLAKREVFRLIYIAARLTSFPGITLQCKWS